MKPNFEAAALALGFYKLNNKWFSTTNNPDMNTAQSWETAEQIFEWWGRASGNVEDVPNVIKRLTDCELYNNNCITRYQLANWVDSDYIAHTKGLKHTIGFLLARLDAISFALAPPTNVRVTS